MGDSEAVVRLRLLRNTLEQALYLLSELVDDYTMCQQRIAELEKKLGEIENALRTRSQ